jgi:hypothetical protein
MKIKPSYIWTIFIPLILACGSFNEVLYPSFSPHSYVEGLWVPSEDTLEYMKQAGYQFSEHSIEFKPDGTLVVTRIPVDWILHREISTTDYYSGLGAWLLADPYVKAPEDLRITGIISATDGVTYTIQVSTVLERLMFTPANSPHGTRQITFQKCFRQRHLSDQEFAPLILALEQSNRIALGFSPLTAKDVVVTDSIVGASEVWLHVYPDFSSHDISFRLKDHRYIWTSEQEIFTGPKSFVGDPDSGPVQEEITLQYQLEAIDGGPINELMIDYTGPDPRLANRSNNWYLSNNIQVVLPILKEWRQWQNEQPPSPQSFCP